MDFYEGWNLRNRLIEDGFLDPSDNIEGIEMDSKIAQLAKKHYGWKPAEPSSNLEVSDPYRESLEQQTANDRLSHIWEIAIDYDGYRSYRGCASLLDEIIGCTQVKVKPISQVVNEIALFKAYNNCNIFFGIICKTLPFYWSFPIENWKNIENWCEQNGYQIEFMCLNHDEEGGIIGVAMKIDKKGNDNNNDTI